MSSVPSEVLRDVLLPLDRWTLDDVQFTDKRFLRLITERMSDVCLRQVNFASSWVPDDYDDVEWIALIQIHDRPDREIRMKHEDIGLFSEFVQALRSSRVLRLSLDGFDFKPEHAALILQKPIFTDELVIRESNCAELTPTQFQEVLLHFSPTTLIIRTCQLRACQLTDELIRALNKNRMRLILFHKLVPVDGGSFHVADSAVIDFCVQEDVQTDQEEEEALGQLVMDNGTFTKQLFKRLVEASSVSRRTLPLRITVSAVRCEEEELRDFAQRLSYRLRGTLWQKRIYDFPGEQRGANAAKDLQIVLHSDNRLEMVRAQRPNRFFTESDE